MSCRVSQLTEAGYDVRERYDVRIRMPGSKAFVVQIAYCYYTSLTIEPKKTGTNRFTTFNYCALTTRLLLLFPATCIVHSFNTG